MKKEKTIVISISRKQFSTNNVMQKNKEKSKAGHVIYFFLTETVGTMKQREIERDGSYNIDVGIVKCNYVCRCFENA